MEIRRLYRYCFFAVDTLEAAIDDLRSASGYTDLRVGNCTIEVGEDARTYPVLQEWLVAFGRKHRDVFLQVYGAGPTRSEWTLSYSEGAAGSFVTVEAPTERQAELLLRRFDADREKAYVPEPPKKPESVRVFLGHGGSKQYRDLKDHLADTHGYDVEVFETGARAGHTVRDILESALRHSTIAFLVMTAEDEQGDGSMRARQNVVHEIGLFQGRLGWHRAIAVVEEGVELFSNLDGVQQFRYPPGSIRSTFGDVLGVLRREFGGEGGDRPS